MLACFGAKGGVGTSVVAAALAITAAKRHGRALLLDLTGDQPDVFGVQATTPGLDGWLAARGDVALDALEVLEVRAGAEVALLARSRASPPPPAPRVAALLGRCATDRRPVVVDAGVAGSPLCEAAVSASECTLLVTRACYLSLRRAVESGISPTGVVVVTEPGRALRAGDISDAIAAPVVAELMVDPRVARVVDAGLLASRLPSQLARSLGRVWHD